MRILCNSCKTVILNELAALVDVAKLNQDTYGQDPCENNFNVLPKEFSLFKHP